MLLCQLTFSTPTPAPRFLCLLRRVRGFTSHPFLALIAPASPFTLLPFFSFHFAITSSPTVVIADHSVKFFCFTLAYILIFTSICTVLITSFLPHIHIHILTHPPT